jgi:two-component system, NarL family, response regulator LiaR
MVRVYILSDKDLFGQGVMRLLKSESAIDIVGKGAETDQAIEDIERLRPDAVIVESNNLVQDTVSTVARILRTSTTMKVVCLNLQDNKLHVFHGEQREARGVEDLVDAINLETAASHRLVAKGA